MSNSVSRPIATRNGFTLVEMSVVLLIIGLIAGGILVGRDLVKAAELRSLISQYESYDAALYTFKNKYAALPGDMADATSLWGVAHSDPEICRDTVSTGTETCDGNGNGLIDQPVEKGRYWQHLTNAGLIEGHMSGVKTATCIFNYTCVPRPRFRRVTFLVEYTYVIVAGLFAAGYWVGNPYPTDWGINDSVSGGLAPEEAYKFDLKFDDGLPESGAVEASSASTIPGVECLENSVYKLVEPTDDACMLLVTKFTP